MRKTERERTVEFEVVRVERGHYRFVLRVMLIPPSDLASDKEKRNTHVGR